MQLVRNTIISTVLGMLMISCDIGYKRKNEVLQEEKMLVEEELRELITKYDNALALNEAMDDDLFKAKERIVRLLDSIHVLEYTNEQK